MVNSRKRGIPLLLVLFLMQMVSNLVAAEGSPGLVRQIVFSREMDVEEHLVSKESVLVPHAAAQSALEIVQGVSNRTMNLTDIKQRAKVPDVNNLYYPKLSLQTLLDMVNKTKVINFGGLEIWTALSAQFRGTLRTSAPIDKSLYHGFTQFAKTFDLNSLTKEGQAIVIVRAIMPFFLRKLFFMNDI
jgi:hypothetical protein